MHSDEVFKRKGATSATKIKQAYFGPIDYKGEKIAQFHNPKIFIKDLLGENDTKQFTSVLIIGSPGTGKTTLATFIAHNCHLENNYYIVHLGKKELLNFDKIMDNLPNQDIILIFDDVSLVFKHIKDPTKRTMILQTLTEARHPRFEGKDRKVMVIANIHYLNSIEKMWRSQGGWKFYTDLSNEEIQNFNYITKSKFKHQVQLFSSITLEQFRKKRFTVSLTNKQKRTYKINDPFRFIMVYDNSALRFFLVPEESCNICSIDKNKHSKVKASPRDVKALAKKYYGKYGIEGLKKALLMHGQTLQYRNMDMYSYNMAQEILSSVDCDHEKLALELRKDAQIKDKRLYTIRKKKINLLTDLEDIQKNEGNVTFGSEAIKIIKEEKENEDLKGEFEDEQQELEDQETETIDPNEESDQNETIDPNDQENQDQDITEPNEIENEDT